MISFVGLEFKVEESFDVVFFSSPRSVQFFLEKHKLFNHILTGCIGRATADELAKWGLNASFIGSNAGQPEQVGVSFKNWLGDRKVLFP
jgi:uroporphyrinogen-III synthase